MTLRRVHPGDRVALVAPASSFPEEEVHAGVAELKRLGLEAVYDESLFEKARFVAGDAGVRANAILRALNDPGIAALIAVRGGYGSTQVLPLLDPETLRESRKALVGYSDITAILWYYQHHGLAAIHGPMIDRRIAAGPSAYDESSFRRVLMSGDPAGELRPASVEVFRPGDVTGPITGGTLTQLVATLGTPWAFEPPPGSVLFLEDVNERPYRIHRMLTQLAQTGNLASVAAVIFGEFPKCDEPGGDPAVRDVLRDFVDDFRGPVLYGFPSGHTQGPTWTLPFGVRARVVTSPAPTVVITEAAVS